MKMYTFSLKYFARIIEIVDTDGTYTEFYTKKVALKFATKEEKNEVRKLHKDPRYLAWTRCAVVISSLATMGKVTVKVYNTKIGRVPFVKFWPNKNYVDYWAQFDRKKLNESFIE